jgi:hypothetical protein
MTELHEWKWISPLYLNGRNLVLGGDSEGHIWWLDPFGDSDEWERITSRGGEVK